jgi:hypothetical protein
MKLFQNKINNESIQTTFFFVSTVMSYLSLLSHYSNKYSQIYKEFELINRILNYGQFISFIINTSPFFSGIFSIFMIIYLLYAKYYYKKNFNIRYHYVIFPIFYCILWTVHFTIAYHD